MNGNLNIFRVQWPDMYYSFTCRLKVKPINFTKGSTCWAHQFDKLKYNISWLYSKTNKWHDEINDRKKEHEESKGERLQSMFRVVQNKLHTWNTDHIREDASLFLTLRLSSSQILIIHSWNAINFRKWEITNIFNFSFTCHF